MNGQYRMLARAERAEAQVRAVEALCDEATPPATWGLLLTRDVRAVLASTPTEPKEH